ncbi:prepilin-type N-terminal cleavage/methylation domain-containing protein [Cycloclasticus pugetii]|uniref:prepilin-type N-terminal cleavage/methylation domain-containing protein n=1 Tax=Cycloclasticus pugetii TaxID=34068 RepID=UPI00036A9231|nr:prepilin-type N-terminal cleavage/methylation domain-containing protein [Cycloclasticus pugetii]
MKNYNQDKHQHGFSLIEIMIAVLVLAIGILAVSKLQTSLLRSGSNANERAVAASLVNRKVDDLSRFINITSTHSWASLALNTDGLIANPNSLAYEHIGNNAGGRILSGATTVGNINYDLEWSVINYYASTSKTTPSTTPSGSPIFKVAHVVASWDGVGDDTNNVVSFDSIIYRYDPSITTSTVDDTFGNVGPTDKIDDNFDPNNGVAEVDIEDNNRLIGGQVAPNISRGGAGVLSAFESLVFNTSTNTIQRRDRFNTVGCVCKKVNGAASDTHLTGYVTWDTANKVTSNLVSLSTYETRYTQVKENQLGDNDQPFACNACCRDGKDESNIPATNVAYKVCRFKYIAGGFKIFPSWKLIGFNVIPEQFLNVSTHDAIYSTYITSLVRHVADIEKTQGINYFLNSYSTVDRSFADYASSEISAGNYNSLTNSSTLQLQARAIYMDETPDGAYEGTTYTATNIPLDRIPFYEVDLTKLTGWTPDEDNYDFTATYTGDGVVSNQWEAGLHDPIPNGAGTPCQASNISAGPNCISNQELIDGDEGTYSRGLFYARSATSPTTTVRSQIFTGNDGWVDRDVSGEPISTSSIEITVTP